MKQKGVEMAIQIFIVLFVLLAVAMLVLQMVSQQFQQQTEQMKKEEMKRRYQQQVASMKEKCSLLCKEANSDNSLKSKASYCAKSFTEGLDITGNSLTSDYTEDLMVGVGVCEDRIYCAHIYPCEIGGGTTLNMSKCRDILCAYWSEQGFSDKRKNETLAEFIKPGKCWSNPANKPKHWYTDLFDSDGDGDVDVATEVKCP